MKSLLILAVAAILLFSIDVSIASTRPITKYSRPCCSFGLDVVQKALGVAKAIGKEELGNHYYGHLNKKKDKVGIMYTCSAGFVDISHLRDNADWSGHIYSNLPLWLGSGKEVLARNEGGFKKRAVFFPKLDKEKLSRLSDDDKELIAVSITNNMALLHEIATAFPMAVSVPKSLVIYERVSAFSLEDAFSNLQGSWLGVKAARSPLPFNKAMTQLLSSTMEKYGAQSKENTLEAYRLVKNDWWTRAFYNRMKNVLRRDFTYTGEVKGHVVDSAPFCQNEEIASLPIPDLLSDGSSVNDYYEIQGLMKKKLKKHLRKLNIAYGPVMTQKDFPRIIEAIKLKFVDELGEEILFPETAKVP